MSETAAPADHAKRLRFAAGPLATDYRMHWRRLASWRDAFLLFWIFSLVGHVLEILWALLPSAVTGAPSHLSTIPLVAVAAPYGLGALALIWLIWPLVQKKRLNAAGVFLLSALVTATIEFLCAAAITLWLGRNPFWDYSGESFNLFGFVCLRNTVAFGLGGVLLLYLAFPWLNNLLKKIKSQYLTAAFWVLFASYAAIQVRVIWFS